MKKEPSLKDSLCLPFCAYYKPGRNEELACRGYEVVKRLMQSGKILPLSDAERRFDRSRAEAVVRALCTACAFQEDGCDFMQDRNAPPCGGFVLLARLVEAGIIEIGDI